MELQANTLADLGRELGGNDGTMYIVKADMQNSGAFEFLDIPRVRACLIAKSAPLKLMQTVSSYFFTGTVV